MIEYTFINQLRVHCTCTDYTRLQNLPSVLSISNIAMALLYVVNDILVLFLLVRQYVNYRILSGTLFCCCELFWRKFNRIQMLRKQQYWNYMIRCSKRQDRKKIHCWRL